jgi:predicted RNA binding protein YcfA (HicA-like mRNA interferase family)
MNAQGAAPPRPFLTMTPPAVPWTVPPQIRELEARLKSAGFKRQAAKGSHRKWVHPAGKLVIMSGGEGDDAKKYQESQIEEAITAVARASKPE